MRWWRPTWRMSQVGYVALALLTLANSGCLLIAAGAAAGGAAGYCYMKGKVCENFVANLDDAWAAAHTALNELGMPVEGEGRESAGAYIQSRTSDGDPVHITLDTEASRSPAEGTLTRVGVRVATFGDYDFSERILNQIGAHLVVRPPPGQAPAPATTLGPLQPVPAAPPRETAAPPLLPPEPLPAH